MSAYKSYPPVLSAILLLILTVSASAEFRLFYNPNGDSIKAKMISHKEGKVTMLRDDGVEFEADPAFFSKEDQEFIRAWMAKTPELIDYKLEIDADKKKLDGTTESTGYSRSSTDYWAYVVKIKNEAQNDIPGLTVKYRVLHASRYSSSPYEIIEGSETVNDPIAFNRTLEITTKSAKLSSYKSSSYYQKDQLVGCVIRILDSNGKHIMDWTSKEVAMNGKTWDNTDPEAPGGNGGKAVIK